MFASHALAYSRGCKSLGIYRSERILKIRHGILRCRLEIPLHTTSIAHVVKTISQPSLVTLYQANITKPSLLVSGQLGRRHAS